MIFERLILTPLLIIFGITLFMSFRYVHMRRASNATTKKVGEKQPTVLYFRSDNCAPCVTQARYLSTLERQYGDRINIQKIDVDKESDVAASYGIFTLPTTLVVRPGGEVKHINYGLTATLKLAQQVENII